MFCTIPLQFHGYFFPNPLPHLGFIVCLFKTMLGLDHQSPRADHKNIYICMFTHFLLQDFPPYTCSFSSTAQRFLVSSPQWRPTWKDIILFLKFAAYVECLLAKHNMWAFLPKESYLFILVCAGNIKHYRCNVVLNRKEWYLFQSFITWFTLALWFSALPSLTKDEDIGSTYIWNQESYCAIRKHLNVTGGNLSKVSL